MDAFPVAGGFLIAALWVVGTGVARDLWRARLRAWLAWQARRPTVPETPDGWEQFRAEYALWRVNKP